MAPVDLQFKLTDQQSDSLLYLIQHNKSPSFGLHPSSKVKKKVLEAGSVSFFR
jgi:hypothetical protein